MRHENTRVLLGQVVDIDLHRASRRWSHRTAANSLLGPRHDGHGARFRAGRVRRSSPVHRAIGWLMSPVVHLAFLTGFKNRFATLASWGIATDVGARSGGSPNNRRSPGCG